MIVDASSAVYAALVLFLFATLPSTVRWHQLSRRIRDDGHARAERREMGWYGGFHVNRAVVLSRTRRDRS